MSISSLSQNDQRELKRIFEVQKRAFQNDRVVSYETRIDRLDRCIHLLVDHQDAICEALLADFGSRSKYVSLMSEIITSIASLKNVKKNLKSWMKPDRRKALFPMNLFGARAHVYYQPKGVVGVMTPWNVPVGTVFSPLADILGAGNRCMIKPSEFTANTSDLLKKLFGSAFDETEIAVITGGPDMGAAFSAQPFDHLIFTGSTTIGKQVMHAAANNLTPVTLELGGKSPVIVGRSCDIEKTADQITVGKSMNAGQLCVSPDYAYVPIEKLDRFLAQCQLTSRSLFPAIAENPDYVSIINDRHYERLENYIEDAKTKGAQIISLGPEDGASDLRSSRKIAMHIIVNPNDDMLAMQEEIFGPILNVKTYENLDECLKYINSRPSPLALYYFGNDKKEQERVLLETSAGGVSINDIAVHYACDDLPFGGIGSSGMGHYHGFDGFKTFSHAKSVFRQGRVNLPKLMGSLPPYDNPKKLDKLLSSQIKK